MKIPHWIKSRKACTIELWCDDRGMLTRYSVEYRGRNYYLVTLENDPIEWGWSIN